MSLLNNQNFWIQNEMLSNKNQIGITAKTIVRLFRSEIRAENYD